MNDIFHLWEIVSNKNDKLVKIYPFRYNYLHIHKFAFPLQWYRLSRVCAFLRVSYQWATMV